MAMRLLETGQGASNLIYGLPDTGKTEFALHAARAAEFIPVMAGLEDESGCEPNRRERMAHLVLLREMMRSTRTHAVIVDEADDILQFNIGSDSHRACSAT
jgi:transitional endoplasmic reticulum ATPase